MKGKDNGTNASSTKEQLNLSSFPQEIEEQLNLVNGNIINNQIKLKSIEDSPGVHSIVSSKDKAKQTNEPDNKDKNENIKNDFCSKNCINNKNNNYNNENNDLNIKNGINNIDFDKNIIVINKHNLKDLNNICKNKNEKKNDFIRKGEIIDIIINENINYNKDLNTSIKTSYEFFSNNFSDSFDNSGLIQSNSEFPKEVIEKFFEKKRNKKNNYNYISSFGINPLESIKEIQNILPSSNNQKNSKISSKQYKINIKNLKEKNTLLQNYIKSFPVLNCPDSKVFKLNKNYFFNKINDDENKKNINNKNMKNNNNLNIGNNNEKEESEEETINRHIKKKFINKKRNKS